MKQLTSLFLAFCILAQASVPTLWVLDYQLRRAVYVKHCENKTRPGLHCNGKCHLKKRIAASTGNDPRAPRLPENFYSIKDINLFCEAFDAPLPFPETGALLRAAMPPYLRFCPNAPAGRLFKPPAA